MTTVSRRARRRTIAGAHSRLIVSPVLLIAGALVALASIPWLLSMSAGLAPPAIAAASPGSPACYGEAWTRGPTYVARLRDAGDEHARLVKERRASCDDSARPQRLAPSRRAPTHPERWFGEEPATWGSAGWWGLVAGVARSFEVANKPWCAERRTDARRASHEGDVHAPRGPPTHPFV